MNDNHAYASVDTLRNASLDNLAEVLRSRADIRYDNVVPAHRLTYNEGMLTIAGADAVIDDDGVSSVSVDLRPTRIAERQIAERLGIPPKYVERMRDQSGVIGIGLLDANVNTWLATQDRSFFVRAWKSPDEHTGIVRGFMSNRFDAFDDYDALLAALAGVQQAGVDVTIDGCDLTERNMRVRIIAPEVTALAPTLLRNYRTPFEPDGDAGRYAGHGQGGLRDGDGNLPIVFGGFEIRNSENGGGAFSIVPRLVVKVCNNGMTMKVDALRKVHVGGRLDDGEVVWSHETQRQAIELVSSQTRDAVATFLSPEYVARKVDEIERQSTARVADVSDTIEAVQRRFSFTDAEAAGILDCFTRSGDVTAGGVMQAVTAHAQRIEDPDRAADFEDVAVDVLGFVAAA